MATLLGLSSTGWTLAASEICVDALQHLGVLDDGETASGGDMQIALRALDGVLKSLPLSGYAWPKLSVETSVVWSGTDASDLPEDYYGYPVVWKTLDGRRVPLRQINHADWVQWHGREAEGDAAYFYISPANKLILWPLPAVDPVLVIQYQRIVEDSILAASPDLPQYWINPLGYGVANELALKFSAPQDKRVEIAQRWASKRDAALESSIASEVICFEVRD